MAFITKKGTRILNLIEAVRSAGAMKPGDTLQMPHELPAKYIGLLMEAGIQMHEFRLYDGMEIVLEAPAITAALVTAAQTMSVEQPARIGA
jgi:hypothetical protein